MTYSIRKLATPILMSIAIIMMIFIANKTDAYASTEYSETEPNDTSSDAQLIGVNAQTMAQAVSANTSVYRFVSGDIDVSDEDWYKVSLSPGNDPIYIDMNVGTGTIYGELYSSSNLTTAIQTFTFEKYGVKTYELDNITSGLYYIKLYYTLPSNSSSYTFTIGQPKYIQSSYTHSFGSWTIPAYFDWGPTDSNNDGIIDGTVPFTSITSIPDEAIAYYVKVEGGTASFSTHRYFRRPNENNWIAVNSYTFDYNIGVLDANRLNDDWIIRIVSDSSKSKTVTPKFVVYYIAPDLSRLA